MKFWEELIAYTDRIGNYPSNNSSVACVFVATVTLFTEPLPSNNRGYTYRHIGGQEGFMKYAVEMGSVAVIYISGSIKTGSRIQMLITGDTQVHSMVIS
jgi:hypothetical protein